MDFPPVTIVMTTWFVDKQRVELAQETLYSWRTHLEYDGELRLHIADDGSLLSWEPEAWWGDKVTYSRQERRGVGASLNAGFRQAFEISPLIAYFVDDWILQDPLDITPWAYLLLQRDDVGIVRLGPPHPYLRGEILPYTELWQGWGMKLDRYGLTVGHRPELFHKRWIDYYGWHDERVNAQECERLMSVRYAEKAGGPDIVYALPHKFFHYHLDTVPSTSHIEPGD